MPLLPKRNNLDYNPDSAINASKTLKTIALENMKNPVLDPDMKTLSAMDAEKNLGVNMDYLGQLYLDIERSLIRIAQFAGTGFLKYYTGLEGAGMCGGASTASEMSGLSTSRFFDPPARRKVRKLPAKLVILDDDTEVVEPPKRRGRPKGSKNKPKSAPQPVIQMSMSNPLGSIRGTASSPSISSRYSSRPVSSSGNSQAIPLFVGGDPDYDPDDDASSLPSSASSVPSSRTNRSARSGRSVPFDDPPDPNAPNPNAPALPTTQSVMSNLLISLIQKIQRMDFFLTSRIKPAYQKINQKQQEKLSKIMDGVYNLYSNVIRQPLGKADLRYLTPDEPKTLERFIVNLVDNGDELLTYMKTALDKLVIDLSVVLNSARQAGGVEAELSPADNYALRLAGFEGDPTGRMERANIGRNLFPTPKQYMESTAPEARPLYRSEGLRRRGITAPTARTLFGYGRKPMTGCGRNFYGDVINQTRDIPTIWTSVRNCPTKYLL